MDEQTIRLFSYFAGYAAGLLMGWCVWAPASRSYRKKVNSEGVNNG